MKRPKSNIMRKRCHCDRWFKVIGTSTECRPCEERRFCGLPPVEAYREYIPEDEIEDELTHDELVGWDLGNIG